LVNTVDYCSHCVNSSFHFTQLLSFKVWFCVYFHIYHLQVCSLVEQFELIRFRNVFTVFMCFKTSGHHSTFSCFRPFYVYFHPNMWHVTEALVGKTQVYPHYNWNLLFRVSLTSWVWVKSLLPISTTSVIILWRARCRPEE
jgi:hypothetical protein